MANNTLYGEGNKCAGFELCYVTRSFSKNHINEIPTCIGVRMKPHQTQNLAQLIKNAIIHGTENTTILLLFFLLAHS